MTKDLIYSLLKLLLGGDTMELVTMCAGIAGGLLAAGIYIVLDRVT
jgi:hypothetical protein